VNEIHLTKGGYGKLAVPWAAAIEATLAGEVVVPAVASGPVVEPA
jgi:hypothetical protein